MTVVNKATQYWFDQLFYGNRGDLCAYPDFVMTLQTEESGLHRLSRQGRNQASGLDRPPEIVKTTLPNLTSTSRSKKMFQKWA